MKSNAKWLYNETVQVGTDYQDISNVQAYDMQMAKFRDYAKKKRKKRELVIFHFSRQVLSYVHHGYPLDMIVSNIALHHLPDRIVGLRE